LERLELMIFLRSKEVAWKWAFLDFLRAELTFGLHGGRRS
jgi:hypothetical protein